MESFTKPVVLNGAILIEELEAAGVDIAQNILGIKCPLVDGQDLLWLDIQPQHKEAASIVVNNHKGE